MPFEPPGKYAWDLWFAHDGAKQHIFYLQASKEACGNDPEKRHNLSTMGHAILEDGTFVDISEGPVFEASTTDNTWDNLSIWTGCVVNDLDSGKYLMFYTARCREDEPQAVPNEVIRPQNIGLAVSDDLLNWKRHAKSTDKPMIPNPGKTQLLDGITWRDPYVFKLGDLYHCLITARLAIPNSRYGIKHFDQGGCIVALSSPSLYDWSNSKPEILVASTHFTQMEVPQLFWKVSGNSKIFYLLFCAQVKDVSSQRLKQFSNYNADKSPGEECLSGTFYLKSEPVAIESNELPDFSSQQARILAPGLYAGRALNPEEDEPQIYGFKIDPNGGTYLGGIIDSTTRFM